MGEVVNLSRARKARARADHAAQAAENRARHGQTRAAKSIEWADAARRNTLLDGAKTSE